jgi:two-component system sensor histidine kinase PhoQ
MAPNSLHARLLLGAVVVLVGFLGTTGFALERAFHRTGSEFTREALRAQMYALLAAAELSPDGGLEIPGALPEPRYSLAESGLYARITDERGAPLWRSRSLLDTPLQVPLPASPGVETFGELRRVSGEELLTLSYLVQWQQPGRPMARYAFQVAESRGAYELRRARFRASLWGWLLAAAVVLLMSQLAILAWTLRPLRQLGEQIKDIEQGRADALDTRLPMELKTLATRINELIEVGRRRLERYRNTTADLAHRLKTPLSVLRATSETQQALPDTLRRTITDTVAQLDESIAYHLRRASAAGRSPLLPRTDVMALARRLCDTMHKVHAGRTLDIGLRGPASLLARVDAGDLMEILGNLLDNACKWGRCAVRLVLLEEAGGLVIEVHDDGPGIPQSARFKVLARGARSDQRTPGHGIGLAVVCDIVESGYDGRVEVGESDLGGACISVHLPLM